MRALVDDLLLLSQIESGQVSMEHKHVDLQPAAGAHDGALPVGDPRRGHRVAACTSSRSPTSTATSGGWSRCSRTCCRTPSGTRRAAASITVSARTLAGGHVSIGVHNTGSVIPKEDLPRVFERFFQVDRARARKGGSSGLGLSIVAEIVEAHGGTVRAISSEAGGTEFIVILPSTADVGRAQRPRPEIDEQPRRARSSAKRDGLNASRGALPNALTPNAYAPQPIPCPRCML